MIDQAREWLERLHVSNAPEADMALDLLGRLDERDTDAAEELADADKRIGQLECEVESLEAEQARLNDECDAPTAQLTELEEALGADGPEEAIAMARTLREAFEYSWSGEREMRERIAELETEVAALRNGLEQIRMSGIHRDIEWFGMTAADIARALLTATTPTKHG